MFERTVTVNGLSTRYLATVQKTGEEQNILLIILHGWGVSADHWKGVLERLETKGITAFAPDLPGFSKSDAPTESWGLGDYVAFVESFARALDISRFTLAGHSFGGRVAICFARKNPHMLEKLILVDAAGVTPRDKIRLGTYKTATEIGKYIFTLPGLRFLRAFARRAIYWFSGTPDYYTQKGPMRETFQRVISKDLTPYLSDITTPTLIIWGAQDRMTPVSDAHILYKGITGSVLRIFEDLGHSPHVANPSIVADTIDQFVNHT